MIEVVEKKDISQYITCSCGVELKFQNQDVVEGKWVICPICGSYIPVDFKEATIDTFLYPNDFQYHPRKDFDVSNCNFTIKSFIKQLQETPDDNDIFRFESHGDHFVVVFKLEDEFYCVVADSYQDIGLDRED